MIEIGVNIPSNDAMSIFKHLDKDSSGKISYEEIQKLIKLVSKVTYPI